MRRNSLLNRSTLLTLACLLGAATGCNDSDETKADATTQAKTPAAGTTTATPDAPYEPKQEALSGGPYPSLLVGQAWFNRENGKPVPGPARLDIYRKTDNGWARTRVEDADSNVFHKAIQLDDGSILTIGAEKAAVKVWTFADGKWSQDLKWERNWGGKFQRMRDIEIGDVDGDGKDEWVVATHDSGVVAVLEPELLDGKGAGVTEMDLQADRFVHEIEIGDMDGDGKLEFFATPSDRNKAGKSQAGEVVMYKWDGAAYKRTLVEGEEGTHAKEILATDIDGDGTSEFFAVLEAHLAPDKSIAHPVEIRQYTWAGDKVSHTVLGTIQDKQTRFLVPGDFDGDGRQELIAAAMKTGLWLFDSDDGKTWTSTQIDANSGGFEHSSHAADLDGDGELELYVASDDQKEMRVYTFDRAAKAWKKDVIAKIDDSTITWNITDASL